MMTKRKVNKKQLMLRTSTTCDIILGVMINTSTDCIFCLLSSSLIALIKVYIHTIFILRNHQEPINNENLYYWLKTKVKYIDSKGTGTTFK